MWLPSGRTPCQGRPRPTLSIVAAYKLCRMHMYYFSGLGTHADEIP
eukprot:SAG11_NODE_766_length_7274_cov_11.526690_6_plen_46_part_00